MLTAAVVLASATAVVGARATAANTGVPNPDPALISRWQPCAPNAGVTVIVDKVSLGDRTVEVGCAPGDQPSGAAAMKRAGFAITGTKQYGENFICRIDGLPSARTEGCQSTPPSKAYWSYWTAAKPNDVWGYSSLGAGDPNNKPRKGSVQGWAFSTAKGTTVQPRIPAIDGNGPAGNRPAPLPTSAEAIEAGRAWLARASKALTRNAGPDALPLYIGSLVKTAQALHETGAPARDVDPLLAVIRSHAEDYLTDLTPGTRQFVTMRGARLLQLLTAVDDPRDRDLVDHLTATLRNLVIPAGEPDAGLFRFQLGEDGTPIGVAHPDAQGISLRALLAGNGSVPAAAVTASLGSQLPSGLVRIRNCGDEGTDLCPADPPATDFQTTVDTAEAVVAWSALRAAGPAAITDGSVAPERLDDAIARAVDRLREAQQPDGGFTGSYPGPSQSVWIDGPGAGFETVLTTSTAARAFAAAGATAEARRANRWLAAAQLTDGTKAPKPLRGLVVPDDTQLPSYAANGLGYDPFTIGDSPSTRSRLDRLARLELVDTALALRAWAAAPFVNAAIADTSTSDVTVNSAKVRIKLSQGSEPQRVTVAFGTPSGTKRTAVVGTVPGGVGTRTVDARLSGLRPATTYTYRVTSSGGGAATSGEVQSFSTAGTAVVAGSGADLTAAVGYLVRSLVGGDHYESVPGYADLGLTVDGAFALAAAQTRNAGDPAALRRVVSYVQRQANAWTGVGTDYAAGGSLGKVVLLAQVLGRNPRTFTGKDLLAALDASVCAGASGRVCVAEGNYRYTASVFAQALGVIAQLRAGHTTAATRPIAYLRSLQRSDGGFPALIPTGGGPSDVDSTSIAAMALDLIDDASAKRAVVRANRWIARQQLADGGFPGAAGDSTNSAALAVQSLSLATPQYRRAVGNALAFLGGQQNADGGFRIASQLGATTAVASGSDVRASTQVVSGMVTTSYATLCFGCRTASRDPVATTDSGELDDLADTGFDTIGLVRWALLLAVTGAVVIVVARPHYPLRPRRRARHAVRR